MCCELPVVNFCERVKQLIYFMIVFHHYALLSFCPGFSQANKWYNQYSVDRVSHREGINNTLIHSINTRAHTHTHRLTHLHTHIGNGAGEHSLPLPPWLPLAPCGGERGRGRRSGGSHRGHRLHRRLQPFGGAGPRRYHGYGAVSSSLGQSQEVIPEQAGWATVPSHPGPAQEEDCAGEGEGTIRVAWVTLNVTSCPWWPSSLSTEEIIVCKMLRLLSIGFIQV